MFRLDGENPVILQWAVVSQLQTLYRTNVYTSAIGIFKNKHGMIVFSFLTVGNGLSLSKFSFIGLSGLMEGLSKCSVKGVWRKVCMTFLLPNQLGAGVACYAFKVLSAQTDPQQFKV